MKITNLGVKATLAAALLSALTRVAGAQPILVTSNTAVFLREGTFEPLKSVDLRMALKDVPITDSEQPPWQELGRTFAPYHCTQDIGHTKVFCLLGNSSGRQFGTAVFRRKDFTLVKWLPKVGVEEEAVVILDNRIYLSQGPYMESHGSPAVFDATTFERLMDRIPPFHLGQSCWLPKSKAIYSAFAGTFELKSYQFNPKTKFPDGYLHCENGKLLVQRPKDGRMELAVVDAESSKVLAEVSAPEISHGASPAQTLLSPDGKHVVLFKMKENAGLPASLNGLIIFNSKNGKRLEAALPEVPHTEEIPGSWRFDQFVQGGSKIALAYDHDSSVRLFVDLSNGKVQNVKLSAPGRLVWE